MPQRRIITLITDFGLSDHYAGVLKGVILRVAPDAVVVDISHEVTAGNIAEARYLLQSSFRYFPADAIHVAVVDPGVGTERVPVAIESPHGVFVGPDNGIFSGVLVEQGVLEPMTGELVGGKAVALENERYQMRPVSQTFHGRDIFAPAAAHIAQGVPLWNLGPSVDALKAESRPPLVTDAGALRGSIVHVDRFGNAISDVPLDMVPENPLIEIAGRSIGGLARSYQEGPLVAIAGSTGFVEIAARNNRAAELLQLKVGDPILVRAANHEQ